MGKDTEWAGPTPEVVPPEEQGVPAEHDLMTSIVNFKTNCFTRNKERHFIMITGLIHQRNVTIINVYEPHTPSKHHTSDLLNIQTC